MAIILTLIIIELLATFFMTSALVYVMYALYQYTVYGVKMISKDEKR